jgi:hypothetical protein
MMDDQIEASVIFAKNIEIDAEAEFNRHHRPRRAPNNNNNDLLNNISTKWLFTCSLYIQYNKL